MCFALHVHLTHHRCRSKHDSNAKLAIFHHPVRLRLISSFQQTPLFHLGRRNSGCIFSKSRNGRTPPKSDPVTRRYGMWPPKASYKESRNEHEISTPSCFRLTFLISQLYLFFSPHWAYARYQALIGRALTAASATAEILETEDGGILPVTFAFAPSTRSADSLLRPLTQILRNSRLAPVRRTVETMANGIIIYSMYLQSPVPRDSVTNVIRQLANVHLVQSSRLMSFLLNGSFSVVFVFAFFWLLIDSCERCLVKGGDLHVRRCHFNVSAILSY